jgi:putative transposase
MEPSSRATALTANHFNKDRHLTDRETFKANRSAALAEWKSLMA